MLEQFGEISPALIMAVIAGLVQIVKKVKDGEPMAWEMVLSAALGLVMAGGWYIAQVAEAGAPVLNDWIAAGVYGLLAGLSVSGLYDVLKKNAAVVGKALAQSLDERG